MIDPRFNLLMANKEETNKRDWRPDMMGKCVKITPLLLGVTPVPGLPVLRSLGPVPGGNNMLVLI